MALWVHPFIVSLCKVCRSSGVSTGTTNVSRVPYSISPNIYKEAGKLSVHYATFPALLPYSCKVHKEQNDQIQESDAGASVRVGGQNRPCAAVCSMSTILLPGHWCHLAGNGETVIVPFNPTRWCHQCLEFNLGVYQKQELFLEFNACISQKQEPKALVQLQT